MRLAVVALPCLLTLFLSSLGLATPLSNYDLTQLRQVHAMQQSPRNEAVAFTINRPGDPLQAQNFAPLRELLWVDHHGEFHHLLERAMPIGQIAWSPDGDYIWFLAQQEGDSTVSLYRLSPQHPSAVKMVSHTTDIEGFNLHPDGTTLVFWATPPTQQNAIARIADAPAVNTLLYRVSIQDALPVQSSHPLIANQHIIRAQFSPDGQWLLITGSKDSSTDQRTTYPRLAIHKANGKLHRTLNTRGKVHTAQWSPDSKQVAFIGSATAFQPTWGELFITDRDKGEPRQLATQLQAQFRDIGWFGDSSLVGVVHQGTAASVVKLELDAPPDAMPHRLVDAQGIVSRLSTSPGANTLALKIHSPKHPSELFRWQRGKLQRLTVLNPWLDERRLAPQQVVDFDARDGTSLHGVVVALPTKDKTPRPALIYVHGGPEVHESNGWVTRYSQPVQVAANLGFVVMLPNYRGSSGRGYRFLTSGQGDYMGKEFDDILDARQWLIEQYNVDPTRVGIAGSSYGGYMASWAVTKHSTDFAAGVSAMGIANQVSKFGTTDIPSEMHHMHLLSEPWKQWTWLFSRSPLSHVNTANSPLLLLHGEQDERVPVSQSQELYRALLNGSDSPVRLVTYPGEGHGFASDPARYDFSRRQLRWFYHFLIEQHQQLPPIELPD